MPERNPGRCLVSTFSVERWFHCFTVKSRSNFPSNPSCISSFVERPLTLSYTLLPCQVPLSLRKADFALASCRNLQRTASSYSHQWIFPYQRRDISAVSQDLLMDFVVAIVAYRPRAVQEKSVPFCREIGVNTHSSMWKWIVLSLHRH
jgi:hypothetical protein